MRAYVVVRAPFLLLSVTVLSASLAHSAWAVPPTLLWSQQFDAGGANQAATCVRFDSSGNVVIAGWADGTIDLGGGPLVGNAGEAYLAKYSPTGAHIWSRRFAGTGATQAYSVATDASGNVVLVGGLEGSVDFGGGPLTSENNFDVFVAKFNANGTHVWSRRFGDADSGQVARAVTIDASGNVVVVGLFDGSVDFGGGPLASAGGMDIFVAKLDPNGNHIWSARFGDADPTDQFASSVTTDASGSVILTALAGGTVDFGGGPLIAGSFRSLFAAKFTAAGTHVWSRMFGTGGGYAEIFAAVDASNEVVLGGSFTGTVDFGGGPLTSVGDPDVFLAKLAPGGAHVWSRRFGNAGALPVIKGIATGRTTGNVVLTGALRGSMDFGGGPITSAGSTDILLAHFSPSGQHLWSRQFGDPAFQFAYSVASDAQENIALIGDLCGTVDFGGGPLVGPPGVPNILLAKFGTGCPVDLSVATGASGTYVNFQSFEETRGVAVTVGSGCGESMTLQGLNVSTASATVGARIYDGSTTSLIASADTVVTTGNGLSVHVPISATLVVGSGYRLAFFVHAGGAGATGTLFDPAPPSVGGFPYSDATGTFTISQAYERVADAYPTNANIYVPQILVHIGQAGATSAPRAFDASSRTVVLSSPRPNPIGGVTQISFSIPRAGSADLSLFDVRGRRLRTWGLGEIGAGSHLVTWDGTDGDGEPLPSGTYFYRLALDGKAVASQKALVLRR